MTHKHWTAPLLPWAGIGLGSLLALWLLAPVLAPFAVAAVFAYVLSPVVEALTHRSQKRMPHLMAVIVVEILFIVVLLGLVLLIVPILAKELPLMREHLPVLLDKLNNQLQPLLAKMGITLVLDMDGIKSFIKTYLSSNSEETWASLLASLKMGGGVALSVLGNLVLIPVVLFYLLMEWKPNLNRLRALIPPRLLASSDSFLGEVDRVLGEYLRGQLLVMVVLAVYYTGGLLLFGLELALPIGLFTGLAVFVPYVGFGAGLVLALVAALLQFSATAGAAYALMAVALVFGLGQLLESFVLTPRLVGERIGLHPLAVIFALMAFGQLFGFVGVLVALPLSAVLLVALWRLRARYVASHFYTKPDGDD